MPSSLGRGDGNSIFVNVPLKMIMEMRKKVQKYVNTVAGKFAAMVAVVSFLVGLLAAISIAWIHFDDAGKERVQMVDRAFFSNEKILLNSLWMMNNEVVDAVLTGIVSLPGVEEARVVSDVNEVMKKGSTHSRQTSSYEYPLNYLFQGEEVLLGTLSITVGLDNVYQQVYHRVKDLVIIIGLIALVAGGVTVLFFNRLVGQHLRAIAEHSAHLNVVNLNQKVSLKRSKKGVVADELELIVNALNTTCQSLYDSLQEIQCQESMFEDIVTNSNDIIFRLDPQGTIIYANPAAEVQMGENLKEVIKETILLKKYPDLYGGKALTVAVQSPIIGQPEQNRSYTLRLAPEMSAQGELKTIIGSAHDTTVYNREMEFLRAIFANAPVLMVISDMTTGCCSDLNDKFVESTGYSRGQAVGSTLVDLGLVRREDKERIFQILESVGKVEDIELTTVKANGQEMICRCSCQIIIVEGEQKVLSIAHDVTQEKLMAREQEALRSQLIQSSKLEAIGTLAGGIAHDFNNILSVVLGFTELALEGVEKGNPLEDDLQEVYVAGARAKELVSQILTFARQSDEELKPIQIDFIVKEVLKFIRSSIPATIEIIQNIASDSLVIGNATQIHRIIMNLCTNAAHSMGEHGGVLTVSLKDVTVGEVLGHEPHLLRPGSYVEIKVSDVGEGIDPLIIDKIFEPYFTTKEVGEGTGMGLAMVHGIVEAYGGQIYVQSIVGEGTTFTIYLPVARDERRHHQQPLDDLPVGEEHILFVDDEVQIVKMAQRMLSRLGYSVTTMTSSVEALEVFRLKADDFDLLISDVSMPGMSGDQLAQKVLAIRADMPIILCTGYSKALSATKASQIGIKAFAYKPIVREELAKTVRNVLDLTKG